MADKQIDYELVDELSSLYRRLSELEDEARKAAEAVSSYQSLLEEPGAYDEEGYEETVEAYRDEAEWAVSDVNALEVYFPTD